MVSTNTYWNHVRKVDGGHYYWCVHCYQSLEPCSLRTIKVHVAQIDETGCRQAPKDVRRAALKALRSRARIKTPAVSDDTLATFDKVSEVIEKVVSLKGFVPRLASVVYYYVNDVLQTGPEPDLQNAPHRWGEPDRDFRDLLTAFYHMKELLVWKKNSGVIDPVVIASVQECLRSDKYHKVVQFVVSKKDFWDSGEEFVTLIAPLVDLLAIVLNCGARIGHIARCCETAKSKYETLHTGDKVCVVLEELWDSTLTVVSKAARSLDPSYIYDGRYDRDEVRKCLEDFSGEYVAQGDRKEFMKQVDAYLLNSTVLKAVIAEDNFHPTKFWMYFGNETPLLGRYGVWLVNMKYRSGPPTLPEWVKLSGAVRTVKEEELEVNKDEVVYPADVSVLVDPFLKKQVRFGDGYFEMWRRLRRVNDLGMDYITSNEYQSLLSYLDCLFFC